ncbi:MAG TPA: carbohydrate porin, partial [Terrimicrobiaceae bacterium]|nr:carbohydrate porin [Terrimicrobiaceae bacterium]
MRPPGWRLLIILLAGIRGLCAEELAVDWWNGKYASGNWLGVRDRLEDRGVAFTGNWKGTFYGIVAGGLEQRGAFDEELHFHLKLDFEKMLGLTGLSAYGSVRWRDGDNPNLYTGNSAAFNPSNTQVGKQWRLMPLYLTWESRDLLPVKDMITLSGGWTNPYFFFIQQPESRLFVNNAVHQTKGLVNSGFPWSGAYNTWGGHLKVKPADWHYVQAGLYMAIPGALSTANHGLYFQGAHPPDSNGLYVIGETGFTPKIGAAKLPGRYTFGGIYFGLENRSFFGETYDGRYALYWQADQMLFRESAPAAAAAPDGKSVTGKASLEPVRRPAPKPSEQGLYAFSFLSYAPKYNNAMPFYFHAGLVYKGLIPTRDTDQLGIVFGYGNYSFYKIVAENARGVGTHQTYEAVLEFDYRLQLTKFAYVQPFLQYLIRPNGTGLVENATVLG